MRRVYTLRLISYFVSGFILCFPLLVPNAVIMKVALAPFLPNLNQSGVNLTLPENIGFLLFLLGLFTVELFLFFSYLGRNAKPKARKHILWFLAILTTVLFWSFFSSFRI